MGALTQLVIFAIMLGGFYALMSQGLAISFGVMRFPNIAHGNLVICGAYTNWLLSRILNIDGVWTIPLTMVIGLPIGWLVARLILIPVLERTHFVQILVSVGLSIFIEAGLILIFSANAARIQSGLSAVVFRIGDLVIPGPRLLMLGIAVVLIAGFTVFIKWSRFGKMMRATADDVQAAIVVGIPVRSVFANSFALGTMLCFAAGAAIGIDQAFVPDTGLILTLKAFVIVVVGGYSRVLGTIIAAMALALIEVIVATYVPGVGAGLSVVLGVVLLAVVLLFRPEGMLNRTRERAKVA
jgi:branched-chain amino acid transport system permease protein